MQLLPKQSTRKGVMQMDMHEVVNRIGLKTGHQPKRSGQGYTTRCPAHDDQNPSLSIGEGSDGKILFTCFAGCTFEAICTSLDLQAKDLFPERAEQHSSLPQKIYYDYMDERGKKLYSKVRIEPGFDGRKKSFYWERIDEAGRIHKNLNGCERVFYRLPELLAGIKEGKTIHLVEGEKDVDRLIQSGLIATTTTDTLKWCPEYTSILEKADVVILFDYDKAGFERRDLLCRELQGRVGRLRVVELPGLEYQESHGQDVSDWLARGHTTRELVDIVEKTPDHKLPQPKKCLRAVSLSEFFSMELPKRELLLTPFLPSQGLCLLYAKRGVGKTHVALGIGYAVATGGTFLKWSAPCPKRVLYLDGEMPAISMQERLLKLSRANSMPLPDQEHFRLITPDLQEGPIPNLISREGQQALEEYFEDFDLLILDNLSSLVRNLDENKADDWQPIQDWALGLRRAGKSILFVHHAGKGGMQRGTSKREDILDTVITLHQPKGYRQDQGAFFEVHYEKARDFCGADAEPFSVRFAEVEGGGSEWIIEDASADEDTVVVAKLVNEGKKFAEIMVTTGLSKSQVETRKKWAKEKGLIG